MSQRTGGGKEVLTTAAVAVGVGVGVAALAGLGLAGAAFGAGVLSVSAASNSFARRAKPALQPADVRRDEQGRIENWAQLLRAVQHGGIAPELRAELWPRLLGAFAPASSEQERSKELERLRRLYIKLVLVCKELDAQLQALRSASTSASAADCGSSSDGSTGIDARDPSAAAAAADLPPADSGLSTMSEAGSVATTASRPPQQQPLPLPGNLAAFAEAHRIIVMDAVRTDLRRAAQSGIGGEGGAALAGPTLTILPVAVGDGLPELMMVSPQPEAGPGAPSSDAELAAIAADPAAAAAAGQLPRWRSQLAAEMLWGASHLDEPSRRQMLRLVNILSAYSVHDPETGYCQGMSDLASVFVQLFEDDALAFACFERLMRSARRNFRHDETGIRHQLQQIARVLRDTDPSLYTKLQQLGAEDCMFAYRMVVVMLRRELPPAACCTLWEMQWALEAAAEAELAAAASAAAASAASTAAGGGGGGGGSGSGSGGGGGRSAGEQQPAASVAAGSSNGSGSSAAGTEGAGAADLRSTVQGLSEATAAATRAVAASSMAQRGGSGSRQQLLQRGGSGKQQAGEQEPPEFVLQFIAAVVRAQRARIMIDCKEHDDILRLFNSLQIDFWPGVAQARKQYKAYSPAGATVMQRL